MTIRRGSILLVLVVVVVLGLPVRKAIDDDNDDENENITPNGFEPTGAKRGRFAYIELDRA